MLQTERMPDLVDVMRMGKDHRLKQRQLPLQVDENLTLVMDLSSEDLVQEIHQVPQLKIQSFESFLKKYRMLNKHELQELKVNIKEILVIMRESIDCVGCRRSAETLFHEMAKLGQNALFPLLVVEQDISIRCEFYGEERCMYNLLQNTNGNRLSSIASSRRQSKKSRRCIYHSLESQRLVRPMASGWQDIWKHMTEPCRDEIVLIEADYLNVTVDNYLKKHRFCGDCRTKVMKAYALLVEVEDPSKEKGYVEELYSGIKRCIGDKHVHLDTDINYIGALISRAEPELMGNRRERHAKTIEIAQEEVLTCLGICVYERLHRIQLRIREEQYTCQVLAAAAIDGLARKFETIIETKQGDIYCNISRDKKVQKRKRIRKQKRLQKKETKQDDTESKTCCHNEKCTCDIDEEIDFVEDDIDNVGDDEDDGLQSNEREDSDETCDHVDVKCTCKKKQLTERVRKLKLSGDRKKSVSTPIKPCSCVECNSKGTRKSKKKKNNGEKEKRNKKKQTKNSRKNAKKIKKPVQLKSQPLKINTYDLNEEDEENDEADEDDEIIVDQNSIDDQQSEGGDCKSSVINHDHLPENCSSCPSLCDHSQDYGYASAENNNHSNCTSSPDGSDVACSEGFCNHSGDLQMFKLKCYTSIERASCRPLPLHMLLMEELEKNVILMDDTRIPSEEVEMYKVCAMLVNERRLKLRETLKSGFANLKDPNTS